MAKKRKESIITRFRSTIENNLLVRNIVLAVSILIILVVLVFGLLGVYTRHGQRIDVPDFKGLTIQEALYKTQEMELQFEITDSLFVATQPKGAILEQYPKAGNYIKKGRRIFVTTNSFKPKMVPVPYVTGFSLRQAKNKIVGAGFEIDRITYKEDIATFNVLGEYYKGKEVRSNDNLLAESGSSISLVVGLNPSAPQITVPNLVGLTLVDAKNRLWESGFNIGDIDFDRDVDPEERSSSRVQSQNPLAARGAMHGRAVSISLSSDSKKIDNAIANTAKEIAKYQKEQEELDDSPVEIE